MAWVIADGLTTTFTCCVDTIYISAFVDIEANNPPKFLSNDLREGFGLDRAEEEAPAGATKLYRPVDGTSTLTLTPPPTPTPTLTLPLTLALACSCMRESIASVWSCSAVERPGEGWGYG